MPFSMLARRHLLTAFVYTITLALPQAIFSQELRSLLFSDDTPVATSPNKPEKIVPLELGMNSNREFAPKVETETIRERFKNGKVHIERQVTLDGNQNYVNHGNFTEWSAKGEVTASGTYEMGERQGTWVKFYQAKDAALFSTQPYARFKAPFQSAVEFRGDKMDGLWAITDADQRVVSQIQLNHGIRNGKATWFHSNGQTLYQAEYKDGVLNGLYVEKTAEGKVVRQDAYVDGRKSENVKEHYPSMAVKSEMTFLTAGQIAVSNDDWDSAKLATYSASGEKVKHGSYKLYFDNGQLMSVGSYDRGSLTGSYESWHANGEKAVSGNYVGGSQDGTWNWWHQALQWRSALKP